MSRLIASSRYAKAYFEATKSSERQEKRKEVEDFLSYLEKDESFKKFLVAPTYDKYRKFAVIDEMYNKEMISKSFCNYLKIILDNKRSFYLTDILEETIVEADTLDGVQRGYCYTAFELDEKQKEKITLGIGKKINSKVKLKFIVQKNLLGGIRVFINDQLFDGTLVARNKALKSQITGGR